jgi:2-methylisocitrate lyase-like PEP mutase family enzyme
MLTPKEKAEYFRTLHVPGRPLVLFNIWDAGSAKGCSGGRRAGNRDGKLAGRQRERLR